MNKIANKITCESLIGSKFTIVVLNNVIVHDTKANDNWTGGLVLNPDVAIGEKFIVRLKKGQRAFPCGFPVISNELVIITDITTAPVS